MHRWHHLIRKKQSSPEEGDSIKFFYSLDFHLVYYLDFLGIMVIEDIEIKSGRHFFKSKILKHVISCSRVHYNLVK